MVYWCGVFFFPHLPPLLGVRVKGSGDAGCSQLCGSVKALSLVIAVYIFTTRLDVELCCSFLVACGLLFHTFHPYFG